MQRSSVSKWQIHYIKHSTVQCQISAVQCQRYTLKYSTVQCQISTVQCQSSRENVAPSSSNALIWSALLILCSANTLLTKTSSTQRWPAPPPPPPQLSADLEADIQADLVSIESFERFSAQLFWIWISTKLAFELPSELNQAGCWSNQLKAPKSSKSWKVLKRIDFVAQWSVDDISEVWKGKLEKKSELKYR